MPVDPTITEFFDSTSIYFNGALSFLPPPSASNVFIDGVSPAALTAGEIQGNTTVVDGHIQSSNYVASTTGWRLTPTSGDINFTLSVQQIILGTSGYIRGGQTAYNTGTGFFLGYESAAYKFSVGNATDYLTWDGTSLVYTGITSSLGLFGDGSDGDFTISAGTTTLSADKKYKSLTVSAGAILITNGYDVSVAATLTNAGTIHNNGGAGGQGGDASGQPANTGGSAGAAGAAAGGGTFTASKTGGAGGIGADSSTAGTAGSNGTAANPALGGAGGNGGASGTGLGGGTAGGTGGTVTGETISAKSTAYGGTGTLTAGSVDTASKRVIGSGSSSGSSLSSGGGAGGGGSPSAPANTSTGGGGGGGASGGVVSIRARTLTNSGTISANGGAGGNAGSPGGGGANKDGSGGGGGGGGGTVFLVYETLTNTGSIVASGGAGGTGTAGTGSGNSGSTGVTGSAGKVFKLQLT